MFRGRSIVFGIIAGFALVIMTITTPPQVRPAGYNQYPQVSPELERRLQFERERQQLLMQEEDADHSSGSMKLQQDVSKKIDLALFVVFHKRLHNSLYEDLDRIPLYRLPPKATQPPNVNFTTTEEKDTATLVDYIEDTPSTNKTSLFFMATNEAVEKQFDPALTQGRLLYEHLMPGYDESIGTALHEHGAMNTIFFSNLTHALPSGFYGDRVGGIVDAAAQARKHDLSQGSARARFKVSLSSVLKRSGVAADHDNDGVQEWIGVFQHDMLIDGALIQLLRRRIMQRTVLLKKGTSQSGMSALQAHQLKKRDKVMPPSSPPKLHCCIFYAISYPTQYLLRNPLGHHLLESFNKFFNMSLTMKELPQHAILDAFVVPNFVFNRMMPFLHSVMERIVAKEKFPSPKIGDTSSSSSTGAKPLEVMERALALALAAEGLHFTHVQIPLRHEKPSE